MGKRLKRKNRIRLPGILMLLCALAVVITPASPAGVAVDSPVEQPAPPVVEEIPVPVAEPAPAAAVEAEPLPVEEPEEEPWAPVAETLAVEDTYFADAAFLGDSRTEGFYLYSGLKEGDYYYAVGATVESVFSKKAWGPENARVPLLDALAKEEDCARIYVMLGVNELGWAKVDIFREQYAKVISRLREDHPGAEVVLQSILPVSARQEAKQTYVNNARILAYNDAIMALAEETDCAYVNVAEAVIGEDGCLRSELTSDGVHLNIKGCKIWLDYLKTHTV